MMSSAPFGSALRVVLRRAHLGDRDPVYAWRNHEATRRYFADAAPIPKDSHDAWFTQSLQEPRRHLLIAEDEGGRPVGVLRFDEDDDATAAEVSIYVVPDRRGEGWGVSVLVAGERWLAEATGVARVRARVMSANQASLRAFTAAGYVPKSGPTTDARALTTYQLDIRRG